MPVYRPVKHAWSNALLPAPDCPACTLPQAQVDGQSRVPQVQVRGLCAFSSPPVPRNMRGNNLPADLGITHLHSQLLLVQVHVYGGKTRLLDPARNDTEMQNEALNWRLR
jgi:hypothetical protein